jgi:serine protease Do
MIIRGLGEIAERVRRSTVLVQPGGRGSGSGVVWSGDGLIITNAHVMSGPRARISLWDGREFSAAVTARDERRDLAALRIFASELPAATSRDSSEVRAGEIVLAVGNPFGFLGALTTGVVHAVGPLRGLGTRNWVQSDVRLAPGNSGGPLTDAQGRVVGISSMMAGRLALAIPSNDVRHFLQGPSGRNWLGVTLTPVRLPGGSRYQIGLLVLGIEPSGPASLASLMPGDILLGSESRLFRSTDDLADALDENIAGVLRVAFLRGDYHRVRKVSVQLQARKNCAGAAAA